MSIALVTITHNDDYKLTEWYNHYLQYKQSITLHIIVDNNSNSAYKRALKDIFRDSIIIERESNGGCTIAYNDGIRYALRDSRIDAIFLLANDIKIDKEGIQHLREILFSHEEYSMVSPIVLKKDATLVENFGCSIKRNLYLEMCDSGIEYRKISLQHKIVEAIPGGINLAKREFYEKVGLQDEKLFMYSDEVDTAFRSKKANYKIVSTNSVQAWHQHINPNYQNRRHPYSRYLMARNKVYLAKKHLGRMSMIKNFLLQNLTFFKNCFVFLLKGKFHLLEDERFAITGSLYGLIGNMKENKYSKPH